MRRLLIRLIAVESMMVGWLAYWLFLVYANNPSVGQGLASQLGRFPQLSFTTIDISVLVIIASLSIFLAFKFQRGLRPGIRLERALQMLENLMKRNLVLEAQVAELKMEKAHMGPPTTPTVSVEPKVGSWERAFRTPIEAGPALSLGPSQPPSFRGSSLEHETQLNRGTPRVETRATLQREVHSQAKSSQDSTLEEAADKHGQAEKGSGKGLEKPFEPITRPGRSAWEDSPRHVSETGVLTPSPMPKSPASVIPVSTSKQPYIPVPVPKAVVPPSVILRPGAPTTGQSPSSQPRPSSRGLVPTQASPRSLSSQVGRPVQSITGRQPSPMVPLPVGFAIPRSSPAQSPPVSESKPEDSDEETSSKDGGEDETKPESKPGTKTLKRFTYEEE